MNPALSGNRIGGLRFSFLVDLQAEMASPITIRPIWNQSARDLQMLVESV
jgi:hypothetical protein